MKRYIILPLSLLLLLFVLYILRNQGYILWIQGSTNTSVSTIIWILFLVTIFIEMLYMIFVYKNKYLLIPFVFLGVIIGGSLWLEINSVTSRYYYEQNDHQILVVNNKRLVFGEIKFYYKDNLIISEEFASCGQNPSVICNYYIEDDNLIIEMYNDGEVEERIILIPTE